MVKNRLIFVLHIQNGTYMLSRNFSLQEAGDLSWLKDFYSFDSISGSIDELIVLNVSRGTPDQEKFGACVKQLTKGCFMPLAAGGGVRTMADAFRLMQAGADKLVLNTPIFHDPTLVRELVHTFGSQCVVACLDFKVRGETTEVFARCGSESTGLSLEQASAKAIELGVGELMVHSMDRDGTGQGLLLEPLRKITAISPVPVIASGGVGTYQHLVDGIKQGGVNAVATANLFNFMGEGLTDARSHMIQEKLELARWPMTPAQFLANG